MTLHRCIGCKFAQWKRTTAGSLHPSGGGRCTWELKVPAIPASKAFGGLVGSPYLIGGFITRKEPIDKCPTYQPEEP